MKTQIIRLLLIMLVPTLLLSACKEKDTVYNEVIPKIEVVSINPSSVKEYEGEVEVTLYYRDGDGDLGENNPDVHNLFFVDSRIGIIERFRIPELAPQDANILIAGTLKVSLPPTGITDNSSSQSFQYTVYVRDRANNESERVETPTITVTK